MFFGGRIHIRRDEVGTFFRYLQLLLVGKMQGRQGLVATPKEGPNWGNIIETKLNVELR